jgi:hypothetical protein
MSGLQALNTVVPALIDLSAPVLSDQFLQVITVLRLVCSWVNATVIEHLSCFYPWRLRHAVSHGGVLQWWYLADGNREICAPFKPNLHHLVTLDIRSNTFYPGLMTYFSQHTSSLRSLTMDKHCMVRLVLPGLPCKEKLHILHCYTLDNEQFIAELKELRQLNVLDAYEDLKDKGSNASGRSLAHILQDKRHLKDLHLASNPWHFAFGRQDELCGALEGLTSLTKLTCDCWSTDDGDECYKGVPRIQDTLPDEVKKNLKSLKWRDIPDGGYASDDEEAEPWQDDDMPPASLMGFNSLENLFWDCSNTKKNVWLLLPAPGIPGIPGILGIPGIPSAHLLNLEICLAHLSIKCLLDQEAELRCLEKFVCQCNWRCDTLFAQEMRKMCNVFPALKELRVEYIARGEMKLKLEGGVASLKLLVLKHDNTIDIDTSTEYLHPNASVWGDDVLIRPIVD